MCQGPLPAEQSEPVKTCAHCGADLTRWMSRVTPPPLSTATAPEPLPKAVKESNLNFGILGALAGACLGVSAMFGFYELAGFRFPLLGVGIGILTGMGARQFYKGTGHTLGMISGAIAMTAVVGTLFLMYGTFPS